MDTKPHPFSQEAADNREFTEIKLWLAGARRIANETHGPAPTLEEQRAWLLANKNRT